MFRKLHPLYASLVLAVTLMMAAITPAPAFAGSVQADVVARLTGTYNGSAALGSVGFNFNQQTLLQLAAGTGAGQADLMYTATRNIAASGTDNLDLAGVLTDPLGATLTFGHVKAIYVHAKSTNTNNVVIGAGTNPFVGPLGGTTPTISLPPNGVAFLTGPGTGWAVTASTADILKLANSGSGTGVDYEIIIIGTST